MTEKVEERIAKLVKEALSLRYEAGEDPDGALQVPQFDDYDSIVNNLTRVRKRADRLNAIMSTLTQVKWRLKRDRDDKAFEAEIAYDEAAVANHQSRSIDDYSSAADRKAAASLASLTQKRAQRKADRLVDVASEGLEVVTQIHWQFQAMRQELTAALRAYQIDQNLEH